MGWLRWDQAWEQALYGPRGFYRRPEGPAGHFATSAQGVPGVGTLLAHAVAHLALSHQLHRVVEIGAGRGELLTEVHRLHPHLELVGIDVVPRPHALAAGIDWQTEAGGGAVPTRGFCSALVFAHEWLDVVPTPVVQVDAQGQARYLEVLSPEDHPDTPEGRIGDERLGATLEEADRQWCQQYWPQVLAGAPGLRAEVGRTRDQAWARLCAAARDCLVVAVDYGHLHEHRPPLGSLTGFRRGVQVPPRPDGSTDITAHVAVDSLRAQGRAPQRELLTRWGLIGPRPEYGLARTDPAAYLQALAAYSAAGAATARGGLGDFWWLWRATGRVRAQL